MLDNEFIEICKSSKNMKEAAEKLKMPFSSFKRKAEKLNCYIPNILWSKDMIFIDDTRIRSKHTLDDCFCENSKVRRGRVKFLAIKMNLLKYECQECKIKDWNGKSISLHIDHINGIRNDNRIGNLRLLCPNCHSQTDTYCKSNKNNIRIEEINIEEIIEKYKSSTSINQIILSLGLINNKINNIKLKRILEENNIIPKNRNIEPQNKCACGKIIRKVSTNCEDCHKKLIRKVIRPTYDILIEEVGSLGYSATGRKYGVSDNAIRKWIKQYKKK